VCQVSGFVAVLMECGYSQRRASRLSGAIDAARLVGMGGDDLAAALLHWRHRRSDVAYWNGWEAAVNEYETHHEEKDDPGQYTLPLFDFSPPVGVQSRPHCLSSPTSP